MAKSAADEEAGSSREKVRLNMVLSPEDRKRIDRVIEMMGAETATEATKDAFRLLEFFLKKAEGGTKFFMQDPGEEPAKLEIFGVTTK